MAASSTSPLNTCVLYVQENTKFDINNPRLAIAQHRAQEAGVPFAVIFFSEEQIANPEALHNIEKQLMPYSIPFIVLIGNREARMIGVKRHLNPLAILSSETPMAKNETLKLKPHTHPWPGKVITVEELSN